jgi:hypothetical protein
MNYQNTARLFATALLLTHAAAATAQPNETADGAFQRGHTAFKAGRIHEACQAYEASEKLAERVETELALADCYEQDGKLVSAARTYRVASTHDTDPSRGQKTIAKAVKLEARAAKLRLALTSRPVGLVVKVDGVVVTNDEVPVDTGPHEVIATAPGFAGHASAPVDREKQILDVVVRLEPQADTAAPPATPVTPPPAGPAPAAPPPLMVDQAAVSTTTTVSATATVEPTNEHAWRPYGYIVAAGGVALVIATIATYSVSDTKFNDVTRLCPNATCPSSADLSEATSAQSDGHTLRGASIGMGIGAVVLLGAGGYLIFAPHSSTESHVSFNVDRTGGSLAFKTRF